MRLMIFALSVIFEALGGGSFFLVIAPAFLLLANTFSVFVSDMKGKSIWWGLTVISAVYWFTSPQGLGSGDLILYPVNLFVMVLALICEKCRKWKDQYNLRNRASSKEDQKEY